MGGPGIKKRHFYSTDMFLYSKYSVFLFSNCSGGQRIRVLGAVAHGAHRGQNPALSVLGILFSRYISAIKINNNAYAQLSIHCPVIETVYH